MAIIPQQLYCGIHLTADRYLRSFFAPIIGTFGPMDTEWECESAPKQAVDKSEEIGRLTVCLY